MSRSNRCPMVIFLAILGLSITERANFLDIAFEVLSAFGTVGLSRSITSDLSVGGQMILIFVMLIGRVGPYMLTVPTKNQVQYARAEFPIG